MGTSLGVVRNERGMALVLAIFALVVIGGMVATNFMAGLLEQQSGRNLLFAAQAAEAAEGVLWEAMVNTSAGALEVLPVDGTPLSYAPGSSAPALVTEGRITRLADNLFLVQGRGIRQDAAGTPLASRTMGLLARLTPDSAGGAPFLLPVGQRAWVQLY